MNTIINKIKEILISLDSLIEFFIYLAIAYLISYVTKITFLQSVAIVYIYFILNMLREKLKK